MTLFVHKFKNVDRQLRLAVNVFFPMIATIVSVLKHLHPNFS